MSDDRVVVGETSVAVDIGTMQAKVYALKGRVLPADVCDVLDLVPWFLSLAEVAIRWAEQKNPDHKEYLEAVRVGWIRPVFRQKGEISEV